MLFIVLLLLLLLFMIVPKPDLNHSLIIGLVYWLLEHLKKKKSLTNLINQCMQINLYGWPISWLAQMDIFTVTCQQ